MQQTMPLAPLVQQQSSCSDSGSFGALGCKPATLSPTCRPRRLNILEAAVKDERWRYCRIDGSVSSAAGWIRQNALMGGADAHTLQGAWHIMSMVVQVHGSAHHIFAAMRAHCYALLAEREARVRQFQTSSSIPLFLLTSQVGRSCGMMAPLPCISNAAAGQARGTCSRRTVDPTNRPLLPPFWCVVCRWAAWD